MAYSKVMFYDVWKTLCQGDIEKMGKSDITSFVYNQIKKFKVIIGILMLHIPITLLWMISLMKRKYGEY